MYTDSRLFDTLTKFQNAPSVSGFPSHSCRIAYGRSTTKDTGKARGRYRGDLLKPSYDYGSMIANSDVTITMRSIDALLCPGKTEPHGWASKRSFWTCHTFHGCFSDMAVSHSAGSKRRPVAGASFDQCGSHRWLAIYCPSSTRVVLTTTATRRTAGNTASFERNRRTRRKQNGDDKGS